jgi:hypothetical protein
MGETKAEEAIIAGLATIGALKQQSVTDKILDALSERAVNSVTAAPGANVRWMTVCGYVHGKLLGPGGVILQLPVAVVEADGGRKIWTGKTVERFHDGAVPEATEFGDGLCELVEAAEEFDGAETGSGGEFGGDVLVVNPVVAFHVLKAQLTGMDPVATDEGVDGIKFCLAEEAEPEIEVAHDALRAVQPGAGLLPQTAAPERGFLLDVAIGASQES